MATQADIEAHYDVNNDFFALFLDCNYRVYTCAVWGGAGTLEQAQINKLHRLAAYANLTEGKSVIDVGCGWGGLMQFVTRVFPNVTAHGLTISTQQFNYINQLEERNLTVDLCAWQNYKYVEKKFDAVVSVCAFEHFATLDDYVNNRHRNIYQNFFDWCINVTTPDAQVALQCIVITRPPKNLAEIQDSKYLQKVFPGSALPTMSDIQFAIVDKYEIVESTRIGHDYVKTLSEWKKRLTLNREIVVSRFGVELYDHYVTYFDSASRCFESGYWNVVQLSLKRATSTRVL